MPNLQAQPAAGPSLGDAALHHQAGRLAEAESIYRQILSRDPNQPEVLHLLGALYGQNGQPDAAVKLISHAIQLVPNSPAFYASLARNLKAAGRLEEAITAYRQALRIKPDFAEAQNNLGVALRAAGRLADAQAAFRGAIRADPNSAEAHNNLGNLLVEAGQFEDAVAACTRAATLKPNYGEALNNLGNALMGKLRIEEALAAYQQSLRINPNHVEALNNLGIALRHAGSLGDSLAALQQAIQVRPTYAEAHNNLGNTLRSQGQLPRALAAYQQAVAHKPTYAEAHNNLGVVLWETGSHSDAIASCRKAIELKPNLIEAHNSLGNVLRDIGEIDQAVVHYQRALQLNPSYAEAHSNLAVALKDQGRLDEAIDHARRAIEIRPDHPAHSNLIYLMHFHPHYGPSGIAREQADWHRQHAEPVLKIHPDGNVSHFHSRIRIGYIAPYFRRHVVGLNILPLLREHDRGQFEIFCYSDVVQEDAITRQCKSLADCWRAIGGLSDAAVAELIAQDEIDILVDLSLHLSGNRLLVLARKPAPVQVTFAGYPGTTGLKTVDYRLTDPMLDPPEVDGGDTFEKPLRLANSFWCYDESAMTDGLDEIPPVAPLPSIAAGFVTFGCLNNFCKVNDPVLRLWSRVLNATPGSHLRLLAPAGRARQDTIGHLARFGIAADRVEFAGHQSRMNYLKLYDRIDLGLDTFPYNGHTTSLDSLWMGVPVITLAGADTVGRAGVSQLTNLGLKDLIAHSPDEFVRIATELAADSPRLSVLRSGLRERMRLSPLMDAKRFAGDVESAYRTIWASGVAVSAGTNTKHSLSGSVPSVCRPTCRSCWS